MDGTHEEAMVVVRPDEVVLITISSSGVLAGQQGHMEMMVDNIVVHHKEATMEGTGSIPMELTLGQILQWSFQHGIKVW